ncbi:MAG: hypothetical protein ACOCUR_03150 [Nanoarchaeota archaeon]
MKMKRREFLKLLSTATTGLIMSGCASIDAFDVDKRLNRKISYRNHESELDVASIPEEKREEISTIIVSEMKKYPQNIILNNLNRAYVYSRLFINGMDVQGLRKESNIYLSMKNDELPLVFHHEFSSILFDNYRRFFEKKEWNESNIKGFRYSEPLTKGMVAIGNKKASTILEPKLFSSGFLNQYSTTSIDNDFSEYSAHLMCYEDMITILSNKYPRMKNKIKMVKEFYKKIE